ncbi:hypothetical protein CEXT_689441 [Caerostris extrusa]|uniref:Uncharacterized protein n=1 Tax=Caerostris extrusa TaxID=172846 RepID=A0AAV4RMZ2_CAEEX|nr:hypothetical protein CEXT_689441 [Caerostris extrusa]
MCRSKQRKASIPIVDWGELYGVKQQKRGLTLTMGLRQGFSSRKDKGVGWGLPYVTSLDSTNITLNGDGTLVLTFGRVTSQDGRCTCHMLLLGQREGGIYYDPFPIHPLWGCHFCPFKFQFDTGIEDENSTGRNYFNCCMKECHGGHLPREEEEKKLSHPYKVDLKWPAAMIEDGMTSFSRS